MRTGWTRATALAIVVIGWRASHAAPIDVTTLLSKYEQQSGAALNPCTGPAFSLWVPASRTNESALKVLFQLLSSGRIDGGGSRHARYILDLLKLNKKESEILSGETQRYQVFVQEECQWMTQSQIEWLRAETPQQREALAGSSMQQMKEMWVKEVELLAGARSRLLAALDKDSQRRFETVVNNLKQYGVPERPPSR